ncbi:MAG: IclR family transcriptional regulator C-terminal domain-containing protein [Capsulimonadaceae bacterium]|nr:IclR family transcriptional regulator C-terminal domain-containing protein [Capsulimonadaceae bacterium]
MTDIPVQSIRKAFDLFSILVFEDMQREGVGLSVLANRLGLRSNTAHNLLKSMCATGYVAQTADSKYTIGPKGLQIGRLNHLTNDAAIARIHAALETLSASTNETVLFVTMVNGKRVPLCILDPVRPIKVDFTAIPDRSIYDVPTGRILVSYASPAERALVLAEWGMPGEYWQDIATEDQLDAACAAVRNQGYTVVAPDAHELAAMACPALDEQGKLLGAIGCYAPTFRCLRDRQDLIVQQLLETAARLRNDLSSIGY